MKNYLLILTGILFVAKANLKDHLQRPRNWLISNTTNSLVGCFSAMEIKIPQSKVFLSRRKQEMQKRKTYWEDAMQNAPI